MFFVLCKLCKTCKTQNNSYIHTKISCKKLSRQNGGAAMPEHSGRYSIYLRSSVILSSSSIAKKFGRKIAGSTPNLAFSSSFGARLIPSALPFIFPSRIYSSFHWAVHSSNNGADRQRSVPPAAKEISHVLSCIPRLAPVIY